MDYKTQNINLWFIKKYQIVISLKHQYEKCQYMKNKCPK